MPYSLGIDAGSTSVKLALLDGAGCIIRLDTEKIVSDSKTAVDSLISRSGIEFDLSAITSTGISGSGKSAANGFNWAEYSSALAISAGLLHFHPEAKTILQIGGQTSLVIRLEDGLKKPWKVTSNPLCAAGTGRFLEQQAYRLGISLADFAELAMKCEGRPPRIAARCSVFAKSDLIHLQQKGVPVVAMLYALCESIARMVISLHRGEFAEPVYLVGGVAVNRAIVKALSDAISERNGHTVEVVVPENALHIQAIGAAVLAQSKKTVKHQTTAEATAKCYFEMPRLERVNVSHNGASLRIEASCTAYLGVDIGSTSTKAVLMDVSGKKLLAKSYIMTAGKPIEAVKRVLQNLLDAGAGKVKIAGAGVTGSGRYLVGSFIGADLIKNEITAQTRAAEELDPEADIIEIGGQDAKLVIKRKSVVVDYHMNKACAAGTGSFLDELGEMLGVSTNNGDFAKLAFKAPHTIDLGTRCAAFMGQAVASAQQEGVPLEVITASLARSVTKNYLSKVVGTRKLGNKIILTGAVFYNEAVVSAFQQELRGKKLTVAEHREVSGAIGAALLARETMAGKTSTFKGFQYLVDSECAMSTFICQGCDNNCTIARMRIPGEQSTYYGSRCDRYDGTLSHAKMQTLFDEREQLLLQDYREDVGTDLAVGVPYALFAHDYAPLLIGFLNSLGVKVVLSGRTTAETIARSIELGYSDSCFPLKLLHGHTATLKNADFILYPSAIRLGVTESEMNQKYSCPLVQASPYIIRQVLGLDDKVIIPVIDFSRGEAEMLESFAQAAVKMGFNRARGKAAALAGLEAQRRFESDVAKLGKQRLNELRENGKTGVVIISRSYMSQDPGANLGVAEKLAQLGVVPIPIDFLPLADEDPLKYSDRPYWSCESKFIAAASLIAHTSGLYGLVLTNFGCGPNSFILKMLEDIMGQKPMGQLEIDEHAAEAGIVTRLEAFVDTITGYSRSTRAPEIRLQDIYRVASPLGKSQKTLLIPRMAPHAEIMGAAMQALGAKARVLPEADERNLLYANQVTSGTECLPYRITLGDFMRYYYDHGTDTINVEGLMTGSYGPCRLGKYPVEQGRILRGIGFDLPIRTTVSNNAYRDFNLGVRFERLIWSGIVAVDRLQRLLWRTRPYEKSIGSAEALFDGYLTRICDSIRRKENWEEVLRQAGNDFDALVDTDQPRRPLVGINGEIFLRSNRFANSDLVKACEGAGLEVMVAPISEWIEYTSYRNLEDAIKNRDLKKVLKSYIKKFVQEHDARRVTQPFRMMLDGEELTTGEILEKSAHYLSPRCGSEAVLSIGTGIHWMEHSRFAGVISVMPHGCMPGGIVAAMADKFSAVYQKPWISLTYDGFLESNNAARLSDLAELIRFSHNRVEEVHR
ncbi:MAG: acyl-CoA dehydratase activase [Dehalococcoidia bacterium]|nr:acyl-CoA dehydratase activase [Dehalococcoidia bacterium]